MAENRFAASYSGGKDSILAIHRAVKNGYTPVGLLTTYDEINERSWFHSIPKDLLNQVAESFGLPIKILKTSGERYAPDFEDALKGFKAQGADTCVFGDIDIQEHFDWCDSRCVNAGIKSYFPMWKENRKKLVYEFIDAGFKAVITVVDLSRVNTSYVGRILTKELVDQIESEGADACGENGEYHTFVFDGPLFKKKIEINLGELVINNNYARMPFADYQK